MHKRWMESLVAGKNKYNILHAVPLVSNLTIFSPMELHMTHVKSKTFPLTQWNCVFQTISYHWTCYFTPRPPTRCGPSSLITDVLPAIKPNKIYSKIYLANLKPIFLYVFSRNLGFSPKFPKNPGFLAKTLIFQKMFLKTRH